MNEEEKATLEIAIDHLDKYREILVGQKMNETRPFVSKAIDTEVRAISHCMRDVGEILNREEK